MIYDISFRERARVTEEEREALIPVIEHIVRLAELARAQGLLAFEREMHEVTDPLLRLALSLMIDGLGKRDVEEWMWNTVVFSDREGFELMKAILIVEGCLQVLDGDAPSVINARLSSIAQLEEPAERKRNVFKQGNLHRVYVEEHYSKAYRALSTLFAGRFPHLSEEMSNMHPNEPSYSGVFYFSDAAYKEYQEWRAQINSLEEEAEAAGFEKDE